MPITRVMRSPASDSRSGRMSGMPPATDASNSRSTPAVSAASNSSSPKFASSSLFAVTTGLPDFSAVEDQAAGGLDAADDLDHDVDRRDRSTTASASLVSTPARELDVALLGHVVHGDPRHLELHTGALRDEVGVDVEQAHERRAHVPTAQQSHPHDVGHPAILADGPTRPEPIAARSARSRALPGTTDRADLVEPAANRADSDEAVGHGPVRRRALELVVAEHPREVDDRPHR